MQFATKYNINERIENPQDSRIEEIKLIRIIYDSNFTIIQYKTTNSDWIHESEVVVGYGAGEGFN